MSYTVAIRQFDAQPTAVIRARTTIQRLSVDVPAACGEVWEFVKAQKIPGANRLLALYPDTKIVEIEVGAEVAQSFTGNGRIIPSHLPAGRVATTAHLGPYSALAGAHRAIQQWCAANGHRLAGPSWEIYGHWTEDETQLRTDVFYLLG